MKRFLMYFTCTIGILTLIFLGYKVPIEMKENLLFEAPVMLLTIYSTIFPILIGMILRLPAFIKEIKEKRKWSVDWVKLGAIGIPTLYISQIFILYFSLPGVSLPFGGVLIRSYDMPFSTIAGLIFGYILLDSLKEKPN
ncbi:hypothetical protein [Paucisalibacillus globulus]|uniref:hypothetical protein n=1 Tax=Paucisalibacillus globulus TaxID=351095 RepID=UPI000BB7EBB1|nr:hypothetical protein [Paucisalibacillus globulus]